MGLFEEIRKIGIVPVVVIDDAEQAVGLAEALIKGGLPCAEVTFRTAAAEEAIKRITAAFPEMLVGAGTVLTTEQAERAINAGARFIVAPGLNPVTVAYCQEKNVPVIPGVVTPSEIEQGMSFGLDVLKFFPAEAMGGLKTINAISAPYQTIQFMPTGGINENNVRDYLANKHILACGGSWMVKKDLIAAGEFGKIEEMAKAAADIVKEVRG